MFVSEWVSVERHPTVDAVAWRAQRTPADEFARGTLVAHTPQSETLRSDIFYGQFRRVSHEHEDWDTAVERGVVNGLLYNQTVAETVCEFVSRHPSSIDADTDDLGQTAAHAYSAVAGELEGVEETYSKVATIAGALRYAARYVYNTQLSCVGLATVLRENSEKIVEATEAIDDAMEHHTAVKLYALHTGDSIFVR